MNIPELLQQLHQGEPRSIGRAISLVEDQDPATAEILAGLDRSRIEQALILGITGPPGAGKSTLTAGLIQHLREQNQRIGIVAIDPSSPISGGAILGDRIRMMSHALDTDVVVRSMATRGRLGGLCASAGAAVRIMAASGCNKIIIETVGVGQTEMDIIRLADMTLMVLAPGFGDDIQAMKAGILEVADLLVINKADLPGADMLALHLGTVFPNTDDRDLRLLKTIASENQGLEKLLERIQLLEENYRQDNTLQQRRQNSFTLETMDWALELLRPRISNLIVPDSETDPRVSAQNIIEQLGQEFSK
jgi:LAO/AO transport system kinase